MSGERERRTCLQLAEHPDYHATVDSPFQWMDNPGKTPITHASNWLAAIAYLFTTIAEANETAVTASEPNSKCIEQKPKPKPKNKKKTQC